MIINVLNITFNNEIKPHEVPMFRGAIINALDEKLVLFHNHNDDNSLRYSYPLIQYKTIRGKATIVCIGEGTQAIGEFFASGNFNVMIGERSEQLILERVAPRRFNVQVWEQVFRYRLRRWIPLNGANYKKYLECESLADKCLLLENILKGNILSMGKGLGINFSKEVKCSITELQDPYQVTIKGIKIMCFNIDFSSNVSLPSNIGLGKHASLNHGIVFPINKQDSNNN
ncbi:MAG: hypothetical protein J6S96_09625 [Muribaculaceae bacterium]|nr:hypothetical protein [Muribaculaceae bacterium]